MIPTPGGAPRGRIRRTLLAGLLLSLSGLAAFVVIEVVVRVLGYGSDQLLRDDLRVYPMVRDALLTIPLAHRVLFRLGIVGVVPQQGEAPEPDSDSLWQWPDRWRRQIGVFERRTSVDWSRAWAISEALLRRMNAEATSTDARFLLLGVASPIEVMPKEILTGLIGQRMDDFDADQPSRRLAEISARQGIDYVSMVPAFRQRIGNNPQTFEDLFLRCDGHWTARGHQLAAELVAEQVIARGTGSLR